MPACIPAIRAAFAAATLVAITSATASAEEARCVRVGEINGFHVIDRHHLVLTSGASRHTLVTVDRGCPNLVHSETLTPSFDPRSRVCNPALETIRTDDGLRCRITAMTPVADMDEARSLAAPETGDRP